jgi:hypothetical protein
MPELPICDCISGFPPYDRLTFIYQAAAELSGDDTLPSADCVAGVPPFQRFAYIYAAFRVIAEDDSLPSQECVEGEPFSDQVTRIYQAVRIYAGDAGLPEVLCVRGAPLWQQWVNIYAALYSAAGEPEELINPACVLGYPVGDILSTVFCGLTYLIENANPIVLSATVLPGGLSYSVTFNQAVTGTDLFELFINGSGPINQAYLSGDGTATLVFEIDTEVVQGDVVTLNYTPGDVVSVATGNPLEAFTDFPVTNPFNVFYYLRPDGTSRYLRPDGVSFYLRP